MINSTAVIHKTAQIAEDVEIGPNVIIGENVKLGSGVKIISSAHLEFCEIGDNTIIHPFATIGTAPQDLGYKNEPTKVTVGKNCLIRENVTINRASGEGNTTIVGNQCMLMTGAHVAHNCKLEDEVILANLATLGGYVQVGYGAFIGGMGAYHQNIRIGELAIISGFAGARQDILPYTKSASGCPAYPVGINVIALRRRGFSQEDRTVINEAFKLLISPKYNTSQAIEQIKKTLASNKYVENMIEFIQNSKRGVSLKPHRKDYAVCS